MYIQELYWIKGVIHAYECSENVALRLQACKMLSLLLTDPLIVNSTVSEISFGLASTGSLSLKSIVRSLLIGCLDSDHQVKCQAMAAFGLLSHSCWRTLKSLSIESLQVPTSVLVAGGVSSRIKSADASIQFVILSSVLHNSTDKIGTVRCAAFKALGDLLINRGLCLKDQDIAWDCLVSEWDAQLIQWIAEAAQLGCADTKLAVRIQASWVTGNLLIAVFQYRLHYLAVDAAARVILSQYSWLMDDFWWNTYTAHVKLLSDSEKIVPTAVRSMGLVIGGVNPYQSNGDAHELLIQFKQALVKNFLLRNRELDGDDSIISPHNLEVLEKAVGEESQKMLFSVCQGLGYVAWSCLYYRPTDITCTVEQQAVELNLLNHIFEIVAIQLCLLKHGQLKLQLQAVQILFLFVIQVPHIETKHRNDADAQQQCKEYMIRYVYIVTARYC